MIINDYTGIIYDFIMYNIIYFCKTAVYENFKQFADKDSDIFLYYNEFHNDKNSITPKDDLYPFFYFNNQGASFITETFRKDFDFSKDTFIEFINILQNKKLLKRRIIYYYFDEHKDKLSVESLISGDAVAITEAMSYLQHHGFKAKTFVRVFWDFDNLVDELIRYFEHMVHKLRIFHAKHKDVCNASIKRFCSEENVNTFNRSHPRFYFNPDKQIFGISLFNPYVTIYQYGEKNFNGFIIGWNSFVCLSIFANYDHITYSSISKIFANEVMDDIINALSEEELTITKLSMKLNVSRTTVDKFVRILYDELAILISDSNGNEKYYKVNPKFFIVAKDEFNKKINNLIEINIKGR